MLTNTIKFSIIKNNRYFCSAAKFYENVINRETEIATNQLVPELKLRLITPNCNLYYSKADESELVDPFFAFFWAGGIALSRYLFDNPCIVRNKSCLDFGAGSGAISIAAKLCGAKKAVANDIDHVALIAVQMNARLNHVDIETDNRNLINHPDSLKYDIIFLGDVFYDEDFAAQIIPWIKKLQLIGKRIMIGDPGRHAFNACKALDLKLIEKYKLPESVCVENSGFNYGYVWEL